MAKGCGMGGLMPGIMVLYLSEIFLAKGAPAITAGASIFI